jgi:stage III sporulation protein AD
MNIFSIIIFSIICAVLCIVIKQYKPEYAVMISLLSSVIVVLALISMSSPVFDLFNRFNELTGLDEEYGEILLKSLGICLIAQLGSDLCNDAGQTSIATKIELAGKIATLVVSLPLFSSVLKVIERIIGI